MASETKYRICPFCEATCGLALTVEGRTVHAVRGDAADTFSEGYLCPKGVALGELDAHPSRLRAPMIRRGEAWHTVSWDEAFAEIERRLLPILEEHGRDAVAVYLGNPTVHNTALTLYAPALVRALGTKNVFSASTLDQIPHQLVCALLYGTGLSVPIPDIDHCDYLLLLGANPLASNGSMMTAPNFPGRLRRLRARGGRAVVIDPRRTQTAKACDEHHFIRPGTDAAFLFALAHVILAERLEKPGRLLEFVTGLDEFRALAATYTPERVAAHCGIPADTIRRLARELAAAPRAAIYGRIGTCTQAFGTLASWLIQVLLILTGNLDRPGGALFTRPAHGPGNTKGTPGTGRATKIGRHRSRVSGRPEVFGEFPAACLAEEIETPGPGQVRALITIAGNPARSGPNSARLERALAGLDFMLSLDIYRTETARHADVILPGLSPLESCHYDLAFSQLAVRNAARYSPPVFPVPEGQLDEWETVLRLVGILTGMGAQADTAVLDDMNALTLIQRELAEANSPLHGREPDAILQALAPRRGPERLLDFMLRCGPHGDGFGASPGGLTLAALEAAPHGVDLGPLQPRLPEVLRTPTGKIDLVPAHITADLPRLEAAMAAPAPGLLLIGRRDLRTNNSWMHNLPLLAGGKPRCTLLVHPEDAARLRLNGSGKARVTSAAGSLVAPYECSDDIAPGVVSLPHGWGHDPAAAGWGDCAEGGGVNSNLLADERALDVPSGNAVLCGIPVTITPA